MSALALTLSLAVFTLEAGPTIERKLYPVIAKSYVTSVIALSSDNITVSGVMEIQRQCSFRAFYANIYREDTQISVPVRIIVEHEDIHNLSYQIGIIEWGPLDVLFKANSFSDTAKLRIYAVHNCHPMYNINTQIANIPMMEIQKLLTEKK